MTDYPAQSIARLRERLDESAAISDADATALREMSDRIRLLGDAEYADWSHEKYLMRLVALAEEVGALAPALEDRDVAEEPVTHINTHARTSCST